MKTKKKKRDVKKKKPEKEEVCEIFEVEKEGETKVIKTCGEIESKHATKKEIEHENKLLRNILITIGLFILLFVIWYIIVENAKHFEYMDVDFDKVKEGELNLYRTSLPVLHEGERATYNFYLRNDPRELDKIVFDGNLFLETNAVINMTEDFNCDGDGIIGVANLVQLYGLFGVNVIRDDNASCDAEGRYMFVRILPGNETRIDKTGPVCYDLSVKDCEILEATERMMLEVFVEYSDKIATN